MDKHYRLPILAMVEMLKGGSTSMILQAQLAPLPGLSRSTCTAQIIVGRDGWQSCAIISLEGITLREQKEAYLTLQRCGDLDWSVVATPSLTDDANRQERLPWAYPSGKLQSVPSLRVKLTDDHLRPLHHPYRQALILVDGTRTIEEIAWMLHKAPQEVQQIFAALPHLIEYISTIR